MRQQLAEWKDATVAALRHWGEVATAPGQLTESEMVDRYLKFHRGSPAALIQFARSQAPAGTDAIAEAARYEQQMESVLKRRGNG